MNTTETSGRISRTDAALCLAVALFAWIAHYGLVSWDVRDGDEGYLLYGVERVLEGELLYRDFERNYPPGLYAVFAGLFRWFGEDYLVTRYFSWVLLGLLAGFSFLLARRLAPWWMALFAGFVPIAFPPPWHKTFVPFCLVLGLLICSTLTRRGSRSKTIWCGLGLGALGLFRQEAAAFCFLLASGTLLLRGNRSWRESLRHLGLLIFGAAVLWIPVVAFFAWHGCLDEMLEQILFGGARVNSGMHLPFPKLERLSKRPLPIALFYWPGVMVALGAIATAFSLRNKAPRDRVLVWGQWTVIAALMHVLVLSRSDISHLKQVLLPPSLILAAVSGSLWTGSPGGWRRWLQRGLALPLVLFAVAELWHGYRSEWKPARASVAAGVPLDLPRVSAIVRPSKATSTQKVIRTIKKMTRREDPIFVGPYAPLYYFLADRRNATRHDLLFPGHTASESIQKEVIADLDAAKVKVCVIDNHPWDGIAARRFPDYTPLLKQYLTTHYVETKRFGRWAIYQRKAGE